MDRVWSCMVCLDEATLIRTPYDVYTTPYGSHTWEDDPAVPRNTPEDVIEAAAGHAHQVATNAMDVRHSASGPGFTGDEPIAIPGGEQPSSQQAVKLWCMPCGEHAMCAECFCDAIKSVIVGDQQYPIACGSQACPELDAGVVLNGLHELDVYDENSAVDYRARQYESETPEHRRVYCAHRTCASKPADAYFLIDAWHADGNLAHCSKCQGTTCILCGATREMNSAHACSREEEERDTQFEKYLSTLSVPKRRLHQRCTRCRRWVVKYGGCGHLVCVCGKDWYVDVGPADYSAEVDESGYDEYGYDELGYDRYGWDIERYSSAGFDPYGFDRDGMSTMGVSRSDYVERWDPWTGLDPWGYDQAGYDVRGIHRDGFDANSKDIGGMKRCDYSRLGKKTGYSRYDTRQQQGALYWTGYRSHHWYKSALQPGYIIAPDGNARWDLDLEGPSAWVYHCSHARTFRNRRGKKCEVCWRTGMGSTRQCRDCNAEMCHQCVQAGTEKNQALYRQYYLWPGDESYGVAEMFEEAEMM